MKKIIGLIFASLLIVVGFSTDSSAQTYRGRINNRESRQQRRIYQGARNGSLTPRETYRLERQQAQLRRTEARYRRSGGGLSWRERYKLERREDRTSRSIYRQKHDKQLYGYPRKRL